MCIYIKFSVPVQCIWSPKVLFKALHSSNLRIRKLPQPVDIFGRGQNDCDLLLYQGRSKPFQRPIGKIHFQRPLMSGDCTW